MDRQRENAETLFCIDMWSKQLPREKAISQRLRTAGSYFRHHLCTEHINRRLQITRFAARKNLLSTKRIFPSLFNFLLFCLDKNISTPKDMKADNANVVPPAPKTPWHALSPEEVLCELGLKSDFKDVGLTSKQAQERLQKYGYNKMTEAKKKTLLERIWSQVNNVLVLILVVVAVVSAIRAATCPPKNPNDPDDPNNSCVVTK